MEDDLVSRHSSQIDQIYSRVETDSYSSQKKTQKITLIRSPSRSVQSKKDINMHKLSSLPEAQTFKQRKQQPLIPLQPKAPKPTETLVQERKRLAVQQQLLKALESDQNRQIQQSPVTTEKQLSDAEMRAIAIAAREEHAQQSRVKKQQVRKQETNISKQRQLDLEQKRRKALETKLEEEFLKEAKRESQIEQTMRTQQLRTQQQATVQLIQDKTAIMQEKIRQERFEQEAIVTQEADKVRAEREAVEQKIEQLKALKNSMKKY